MLVLSKAVSLMSPELNVLLASILVWCSARNCFVHMQMEKMIAMC